ncbi:unnamed protein product [Adineta steineri]|uniref:N-acetyltransferase domain-containing protein n=1 Tax=Adineta steineri TaxID=433720 RepID=A0A819L4L1_9BILA|nr:unnamed protein product [Adineta steineri]
MSDSLMLSYRIATTLDCDLLVLFINSSYRGEIARHGWTNENELVDGPRTNEIALNTILNNNDSIILMFFNETDKMLIGCVHLQFKSETKTTYVGMLAVHPNLQGKGYGNKILSLAENYAIQKWNVDYIEMIVVLQRTELIDYYNRRGYIDTGDRQPFPQSQFGLPKRNDLQFCTLRKSVKIDQEKQ